VRVRVPPSAHIDPGTRTSSPLFLYIWSNISWGEYHENDKINVGAFNQAGGWCDSG